MIYLIPSFLSENATETIPPYVLEAVKKCSVIFAENERTSRRFLKSLDRQIVIDDYEWHTIGKSTEINKELYDKELREFVQDIKAGKNIAIISEAGCPGVADPGQVLVMEAQKLNAEIKPLVGPSSILLALMASGLNGQNFCFHGYLPIDVSARIQAIKELERESISRNCTQIFIETPFRNDKMITAVLQHAKDTTLFCIAAELTSTDEWVKTRMISEWKANRPELHKKAAIFLLQGQR
ncbi:MAG: SAM-dependent methyltransferase [Ginsengibacter sp.]|jgi:16S rRNA (cytidine1402-2'-O)-methyltransferase